MSNKAIGCGLAILFWGFCGVWFLFGSQVALVILGLATFVLLCVIAQVLSSELPNKIIDATNEMAAVAELEALGI